MAFGDPMVLATLYNGGISNVNHDSLLIDGPMDDGLTGTDWTYNVGVASPTVSEQSGARTGGAGSKFHRLTYSAPGTGLLGDYRQYVFLRYNDKFSGGGHNAETFDASIWVKRNDASAGTVTAQIKIAENTVGVTSGGSQVLSTGTWYELTGQRVITNSSTVALNLQIELHINYSVGGGSPVIDVDEASLYKTYTFALNAAMPDDPRLIAPGRSFQRAPGGGLIEHRSGTPSCNKHEYVLHFGLVGLAQVKSLRSLWLLDSPMRWTPNLPHLPENLDVRFTGDFNLRMKSPSVNSNNYSGTLTLAEI